MVRWSHIDCLIMRTSFFKCTPPPLWLRAPGKPINDPVKVYQKHVNYKVISFYVTFEFFSIKISNQLMIAKHVMFLNQELWGHRCNHKINSHNYKIHSITGGQEWRVVREYCTIIFLYQCCDFLDTAINISRWPNLFLKTYLLSDREWRGGDCKHRYLNPLQADSSVKHPRVHWTSLSFRTYGQLNALVAFLSQSPAVKLWWKAWNQLIYDMSNNKGAHVHIL